MARSANFPCRPQTPGRTASRSGRMAMCGFPKPRRRRSAGSPGRRSRDSETGIAGSKPLSIVVRDGALWFSEAAGNQVGRITVDGMVTEFPIPGHDRQPRAMVTASRRQHLVRRNRRQCARPPGPRRHVCRIRFPTPNASLRGVTVGPDGNLWCTENFANKIGRMAPDGTLIGEYDIRRRRAARAASRRCRTAVSISRDTTPG